MARDRVRLVLERQDASLAHAHARKQQLRVAANELRTPGDVGVDPLEAAIVERHDVVLDRLDQPQPLQLGQFLRILGGDVLRLRPVVGAVELPDILVERRRRIGLPRRSMLRHRRPTLMIDAAIAHHLEILDGMSLGRLRVAEGGRHADALERRLRDPVDEGWLGQSRDVEDRLRHVDDVMELAANLAFSLHALRPMHDHAVARAAPVRGDLFRPLIGRAKRVRPADGIVVVGLGRAEIVDLREQEFFRLDAWHAVQHRHLIEAAVDRALGGGAVVADDVIDQRVVEHAEIGKRIHEAPDMVIDLLQEAGIDLHLARENGLQVRRHFVPRGNFRVTGGQRRIVRNDAELLLPGERSPRAACPSRRRTCLCICPTIPSGHDGARASRPARNTS